jgi:hypothetical protein
VTRDVKEVERRKKPRKVFGRVRVTTTEEQNHGGAPYRLTVTMNQKELIVRPFRSRRAYKLKLERVALLVMAEAPYK